MTEPMSEAHLEAVLASISDHLVVPGSDAETSWRLPTRSRGHRRVSSLAAAVAVLAIAAGVVIAPVRDAVADVTNWLQLGSTRIERVDPQRGDPSDLRPIDAGLPPVSEADAAVVLGRPLPTIADPTLAPPDLIAVAPEGGVLLGWDHGSTTLWIRPTADPADLRMAKLLDEIDIVEPVASLGDGAVFVQGDHVLTTPYRRVAAGTVLLWIDDGLEYRLESDLGLETMLSIARSIHADQRRVRGASGAPR
jgi:hypothetical protein